MINNKKRFRYKNIKSKTIFFQYYIKSNINIYIITKKKIIFKKIYIIFDLLYNILIIIDIIKLNKINIRFNI